MKSPSLVLSFAALAALASVVVPAPDCRGQEKPPVAPKPAPQDAPPAPPAVQRAYDVSSIFTASEEFVGQHAPWSVEPFGWIDANRSAPEVGSDEPSPSSNHLIELLRSLLPRDVAERTAIEMRASGLHVRSAADGQRLVGQVLEALRASLGTPWELDVRAVTLPDGAAGDAVLAELERAGGGALAADVVARVLAADPSGGRRGGTVMAGEGQWTSLERVRSRSVVADWNVEIAEGSSIADPVPVELADGLRSAFRVGRTSDGRALVSIAAASGDAVEPFRRADVRTTDLGSVELPEVRGAYFSSLALLRTGETAAFVASSPVSTTASVRRVLLVRLVAAPPALTLHGATIVAAGALVCGRSRVLVAAPDGRGVHDEEFRSALVLRNADHQDEGTDVYEVAKAVQESAAASLEKEGAVLAPLGDWPGGGALLVQGEPALHEAAQSVVAALEKDLLRPVRVSVRLVARTDGTPDRVVGTLSAPGCTGRMLSIAAYAAVPYLADYDVEVAQRARIADPRTPSAVGGAVLNARVGTASAGSLRLETELTVLSVGPVESAPVSAAEVGLLERVPVKRTRAAMPIVVETGKPREVDLGENPFGAGRLIAVFTAQ